MDKYSFLASDITCPFCGTQIEPVAYQHLIHFHWGKIGESYNIGDSIRWMKDEQGKVVPPFTLVEKRHWILFKKFYWNSGDPAYTHLALLDGEVQDCLSRDWCCDSCKNRLEAILIKIEQGVIISAQVLKVGEMELMFGNLSAPVDTWILESDGTYTPRYDWYDHPLIAPER